MIRLAKLTDYGIVLMTQFARSQNSVCARELAETTSIPLPTVSKLLKVLSQANLLQSQRGVRGGYTLARAAAGITVADMVEALEGPIALTDCGSSDPACGVSLSCQVKPHWLKINGAIRAALEQLSLADMAGTHLHLEPIVVEPNAVEPIAARRTLPIARS